MDFSHFIFLHQSMVNVFLLVQVPLFLGQLRFFVVEQDKFCPLVSKAGLISVRSNVCAPKNWLFFCMKQLLSLIYALYFKKCNNSIASSKSGMCKLSQKLRCRRAEHLHQVKKHEFFHGYQQLLIAIIGSYSGRSS